MISLKEMNKKMRSLSFDTKKSDVILISSSGKLLTNGLYKTCQSDVTEQKKYIIIKSAKIYESKVKNYDSSVDF